MNLELSLFIDPRNRVMTVGNCEYFTTMDDSDLSDPLSGCLEHVLSRNGRLTKFTVHAVRQTV